MLVVERPENHPLQVENALDETKILSDLQFVKTQFTTEIPWTTRVSAQKNEYLLNPMRLWTKKIG
jgi:hypothetical protein